MADTRADVVIPSDTWTNLYAATGITGGTAVSVYNKGSNVVLLAIKATAPASKTMGVPVYVGAQSIPMLIPAGASGLWCYALNGSTVLVQDN